MCVCNSNFVSSSTSSSQKLSFSLEILFHEKYQEEIDASYIIPRLSKMCFLKVIKELGGRFKYRLHITQKDPKD
jgi:hypothetical protein